MRVTFQYSKTLREKVMSERDADILVKLGHGKILGADTARPTYLTRDMQAAAPVAPQPPAAADPVASTSDDQDDTEDAPKRRGRPRKVVEE